MSVRTEQIRSLLRVEISDIIRRNLNDPRIGFVTVTDAEVSADLRHAKIFVSVMGSDEEKKNSLDALRSAAGVIRAEFGHRARMKTIPELTFMIDASIEHGARIFELLEQIKKEEGGDDSA